jgi:hypothetical protein
MALHRAWAQFSAQLEISVALNTVSGYDARMAKAKHVKKLEAAATVLWSWHAKDAYQGYDQWFHIVRYNDNWYTYRPTCRGCKGKIQFGCHVVAIATKNFRYVKKRDRDEWDGTYSVSQHWCWECRDKVFPVEGSTLRKAFEAYPCKPDAPCLVWHITHSIKDS